MVTNKALELTTDYDVSSPDSKTGTITGRRSILLTEALDEKIEAGAPVSIKPFSGFSQQSAINRIEGLNVEMIDDIDTDINFQVTLNFNQKFVTLKNLAEGWYYLSGNKNGNEFLIIRDTFVNPYIGFSDLAGIIDASKIPEEGKLRLVQNAATRELFTELSAYGNIYDQIYDEQITTLLIYKMLSIMIENNNSADVPQKFQAKFDNYLKVYTHNNGKRWDIDPTNGVKETTEPIDHEYLIRL